MTSFPTLLLVYVAGLIAVAAVRDGIVEYEEEELSSISRLLFTDDSDKQNVAQEIHYIKHKKKHFDWPEKRRPVKQEERAAGNENDFVENVHIVFMNHLDVGYTNFVANVLNSYFTKFYPQAIKTVEDLRKGGYVETFVYTTHPWLVTLYVDCPPNLVLAGIKVQCPNATEKAAFVKAVNEGYITWHAGPCNLQVEMAHEPWLFEAGLDISARLDKLFGIKRKTRVLSQRDVPGMTQSAIPILVKKGISAVSVGVNNMTPPPGGPRLFVWAYGEDSVMYAVHPGGYPDDPGYDPANPGGLSRHDCIVVDGFTQALCFAFRTDNSGPPGDYREVLKYYEILRSQFPNAKLAASTLENFFEAAQSLRDELPVVTNEISDTWIQGVASDPRKCAEYRTVARVLSDCFVAGQCSMDDARVSNASRFLIKLPEHTWGLPSVYDNRHWSNDDFLPLRDKSKNFIASAMSWQEQRHFIYLTIEALQDHPVAQTIRAELGKLQATIPDLHDFSPVQPKDFQSVFICPNVDIRKIQFGPDGSIAKLVTNNSDWSCDDGCHLSRFLYVTYNETDFNNFGTVYNYNGYSAGYYKSNLTANAHAESKSWMVNMTALYRSSGGSCDFYVNIKMNDPQSVKYYGAPQDIWIRYTARKTAGSDVRSGIDIDFQMFNKTSTRLPEALLLEFTPSRSRSWMMSKLNSLVDPLNVMLNGSQYQHVVDDYGVLFDSSSATPADHRQGNAWHNARFRSLDVPIACPIPAGDVPHVFPAPLTPIASRLSGFAFNIYNNIWETNYIMWYPYYDADANFRARFFIDV